LIVKVIQHIIVKWVLPKNIIMYLLKKSQKHGLIFNIQRELNKQKALPTVP